MTIKNAEAALAAIEDNNPDRAVILNNLGNYYSARYEQLEALISDLGVAIVYAEAALAATQKVTPIVRVD